MALPIQCIQRLLRQGQGLASSDERFVQKKARGGFKQPACVMADHAAMAEALGHTSPQAMMARETYAAAAVEAATHGFVLPPLTRTYAAAPPPGSEQGELLSSEQPPAEQHEQVVRLNVREPGVGAQLPLSCRPARHAQGHGYWREQARRSLWRVVKSCVWELPVRALVPLSGSRPHAYSSALHACFQRLPSCTHWPQRAGLLVGAHVVANCRPDFLKSAEFSVVFFVMDRLDQRYRGGDTRARPLF